MEKFFSENQIICRTCKHNYKTYEGNFSRQKLTKSGFKYICKVCCSAEQKKRRDKRSIEKVEKEMQWYRGAWMGSKEREQMQIYNSQTIKNKEYEQLVATILNQ